MKKRIIKFCYKVTDALGWCSVELAVKFYHMDRFPKLSDNLYKLGVWFYMLPPVVPVIEQYASAVENEYMYDWQIHYNPYTAMWSAYHRDDRTAYMSGELTMHPVWTDKTFCGVLDKLAIMNQVDNISDKYEYESGY